MLGFCSIEVPPTVYPTLRRDMKNPYLRLLAENDNYRRLFFARAISLLGDWLDTMAIFVLLSEISSSRPMAFAGMLVIKLLPSSVLATVAGVVADRLPRKKVMIVCDLVRSVVVLGFLSAQFVPSTLLVLALLVIQSSVGTFFEPAKAAMLPDLVEGEDLITANALSSAMWSLTLTLGSALGGFATELFGWKFVIVLDSVSYLFSAYLIQKITVADRVVQKPQFIDSGFVGAVRRGFREYLEAVHYLRDNPKVLVLSLLKSLYSLGGAVSLVLAVVGQNLIPQGWGAAVGISILYTARGLGAAVGPIIFRRFFGTRAEQLRNSIFIGFLICSACYMFFSFAEALAIAAVFVFFAHLGSSVVWVSSTVLLQMEVPAEVRGRIFGFELAAFTYVMSVSILVYSFLLENQIVTAMDAARLLSLVWLPAALFWLWCRRLWSLVPS